MVLAYLKGMNAASNAKDVSRVKYVFGSPNFGQQIPVEVGRPCPSHIPMENKSLKKARQIAKKTVENQVKTRVQQLRKKKYVISLFLFFKRSYKSVRSS